MSDGEGCERIWRLLSILISILRYSTKQHRLDAINLRALHMNEVSLLNAARSSSRKLIKYETECRTAQTQLAKLSVTGPRPNTHTREYFAEQWERKKSCLSTLLADNTIAHLEKLLAKLIDFEEQLHTAHEKVRQIRSRRRNQRSAEDIADLENLPSSIVLIETTIDEVVHELGGDQFKNHPAIRDHKARGAIRVQVAKVKLFEAKVGIIELQRDWDEPRQGTRSQQRYKDLMTSKQKVMKQRHTAYIRQVKKYNTHCHRNDRLPLPTLQSVKAWPIEDQFWDIGHLTHPNEPWAIHRETRLGIEAYLRERSCQEEFRRIAIEVRQMIRSALQRNKRLRQFLVQISEGWDPASAHRIRPIKLVHQTNMISQHLWEESVSVLKIIHKTSVLKESRTWMIWDSHILSLILKTQKYSDTTPESDNELLSAWRELIDYARKVCEELVSGKAITAEELDEGEMIEQGFLFEDGVVDFQQQYGVVEYLPGENIDLEDEDRNDDVDVELMI
ncbi:hypothetical protein DFH28DRAFT_919259 [Melampsora americana]|nr:hypothetical protein DFH28DRAFT_919259 [Melampsora americana]